MAEGGGGFNIHPMEQFLLKPLFGGDEIHWYTPTNATLWLGITVVAVSLLMVFGSRGRALIPSRGQSMAELTYGFVYKMVEDVTGKHGVKYFPYVITLFLFILFANLLGLIPTSFSTTSHIAVTVILALAVFISVTAIGFAKHGAGFLKLFWVSSAPTVALRCVLALIEVISYFVRPISHSVRLAGNIMAGHAVLKVFAGFAGALGLFSVVPILAISTIYALELMVAVVQAYVFAILTCVYLNDALHPGH
ncbi:F0F1 ATP synthase subunit A [Amaricoccus solimangrovi]|uniref:ATP synthase subunit a n=1 Tax=Amaricoccus solimangrovi TaxID=2589815 RepID=A0A501WRW4_9RHOB|nr:F0F1 ATP synthase subunit A [Amaricoccus solimangrovi]TPE52209.1 F0F1 ATP synthase subunit A [Amaricoccus solimangrovi]